MITPEGVAAMVDPIDNFSPYSPVTGAPYAEKEVNHQTGLEVDHTQDGLRTLPDTAGLEAVPAEYQKGAIPQTNYDAPEKETWNNADKKIMSPEKEPERQSIFKRRWKLWALLAALLVIIVVIAVAVPLSVQHKSR